MPAGAPQILTDGSQNWDQGVDSISVNSERTASNPDGLSLQELAWMDNCTVRDGGITQRFGWQWRQRIADGSAIFQGAFMYDPLTANPYPIVCIGGHVLQLDPNGVNAPFDLSEEYGLLLPPAAPHFYFCQAETFLVIQVGDGLTLPLFYCAGGFPAYGGAQLRQSLGITTITVAVPAPGINEIPAAGAMTYFMGRLWYAQGRNYSAGDIVGNHNSGTLALNFSDSVLEITENPLSLGGDGFTVPSQAGNITALFYNANLNAQLGQGQLLIGTQKTIYALAVPVTRADWINTTTNTAPVQTVVQLVNGPVNDRSVVLVNGDVFYQTLAPGITSLFAAVRDFEGWGNHDLSANEWRALSLVDRALLREASGILFDNRMLQLTLPKSLPPGTVYMGILPLDFIPISNFQSISSDFNPVWGGIFEGLQFLQLLVGNFGGLERAFGLTVSEIDGGIDLWELSLSLTSDYQNPAIGGQDGESRVTWLFESPAYNWQRDRDFKQLVGGELWIDQLFGEAIIQVQYRPDASPCWITWCEFTQCQPRTSAEAVPSVTYPLISYNPDFRSALQFPKPPASCIAATNRPSDIGFQFQIRCVIKGFCRVRSLLLYAVPVDRSIYSGLVC